MEAHLTDTEHGVCVDANSGSVFCAECDDFAYDATFPRIRERVILQIQENRTDFQGL